MKMCRDKTFLAIKNIIHNDLGISRTMILDIVEDCVQEAVERQVQIALKATKFSIKDRIKNAVEKEVKSLIHSSNYYTHKKLVEQIADQAMKKLTITVQPKPEST